MPFLPKILFALLSSTKDDLYDRAGLQTIPDEKLLVIFQAYKWDGSGGVFIF